MTLCIIYAWWILCQHLCLSLPLSKTSFFSFDFFSSFVQIVSLFFPIQFCLKYIMPTFGSLLAFNHLLSFPYLFFLFRSFFFFYLMYHLPHFFYLMYIMPTLGSHLPFTFSPPLYIAVTFTQALYIHFMKSFV